MVGNAIAMLKHGRKIGGIKKGQTPPLVKAQKYYQQNVLTVLKVLYMQNHPFHNVEYIE